MDAMTKDIIGSKYKELLMLDCQYSKPTPEYCDAILVSENLDAWDEATTKFYEDNAYTVTKHDLKHGY